MNKDEIISVLKDLYTVTNFRMSLHDKDFNEIAAYPESRLPFCAFVHKNQGEFQKCKLCDENACRAAKNGQNVLIYKCRFGLTEAISPLYNFGTLTGYLMMGQVADSSLSENAIAAAIKHLAHDESEALEISRCVPRVSKDMASAYVSIMTLCARYLTLANAMPTSKPSIPVAAKKYISENFSKKISIKEICTSLDCSKSSLLTLFKKEYGITVGDYITNHRLEEAKKLLKTDDMSINDIAHETGFYDQSYFSKVFSASVGISPSEYRKSTRSKGL